MFSWEDNKCLVSCVIRLLLDSVLGQSPGQQSWMEASKRFHLLLCSSQKQETCMCTSGGQFRQKTQEWDCVSVDDCLVFRVKYYVMSKPLSVCLKPQTVKQLFTNWSFIFFPPLLSTWQANAHTRTHTHTHRATSLLWKHANLPQRPTNYICHLHNKLRLPPLFSALTVLLSTWHFSRAAPPPQDRFTRLFHQVVKHGHQ